MKYIDDLSLVKSLNLRECIIPNPNPTHPVTYRNRTHHILPATACDLQLQLNRLHAHSQAHEMQINQNKSKVMIFNTSKNFDVMPNLTLPGMGVGESLEVVEKCKLLGVVIRSDLKWYDNTDLICRKGFQRLWILRRLKKLGANRQELLDIYYKQVRSVLELAVPVWQPALTQQEKKQIERVQKCALYVILGEGYIGYNTALEVLSCESLETRRIKICEKFAKKAVKNPRYNNWFAMNTAPPPSINTRQHKTQPKYKQVQTRTERFQKSPIPYLVELLNNIQ